MVSFFSLMVSVSLLILSGPPLFAMVLVLSSKFLRDRSSFGLFLRICQRRNRELGLRLWRCSRDIQLLFFLSIEI